VTLETLAGGSRGSQGVVSADVAIVGAGPAGMAAAIAAAESGAAVLVVDSGAAPGGQIWRHRERSSLTPRARTWLTRFERCGARTLMGANVVDARVAGAHDVAARSPQGGPPGERSLPRSSGPLPLIDDENDTADVRVELDVEQGTAALRVLARRLVIATGARERLLPFPGWTLPGVVGIGGAQALLKSGVTVTGRRVAIAGTGPLLLPVADALARAGARLVLVAEQAPMRAVARAVAGLAARPALAWQAARHRAAFARTRYRVGTWVTRAAGDDRVREITVTDGRHAWTEPCDLLCTGFGLVPGTELARLLGCVTADGAVVVDDGQRTSLPGIFCAGETAGIGGVDVALVEGRIAGLGAAGRAELVRGLRHARRRGRASAARLIRAFALRPELRELSDPDTIICRCEDVRRDAVDATWSARQARLYARVGMGPCQGRVCGAALEVLFGWPPEPVRPPIEPVLVSTLLADPPDAAPHEHHGEMA
jgi:NADPH-dependent 2,4-dienoyl-CoA reductase/sulfur reductase-like enzyme